MPNPWSTNLNQASIEIFLQSASDLTIQNYRALIALIRAFLLYDAEFFQTPHKQFGESPKYLGAG